MKTTTTTTTSTYVFIRKCVYYIFTWVYLVIVFKRLGMLSHLWPMGLNVLGYQSHILQRCPCLWSLMTFFHLPRFSPYEFFMAMQVEYSYKTRQSMVEFYFSRSHSFRYGRQNKNPVLTRTKLTTSALTNRCPRLYYYGERGIFIFPFQLTTSRIGSPTRLIHTLLYVMTIHTYMEL